MTFLQLLMAQPIPSVLSPSPQAFVGHCHLVGPDEGVRKPLPGGEAFVNSSKRGWTAKQSFFLKNSKEIG